MQFGQLVSFCKIVELGGFGKAAEAIYVTQPAVSQQVRLLEKELGVALFHRRGREVALTEAGQVFYGYARQIVQLMEDARQAMEEHKGTVAGELIVGASTIPGEHLLLPLLTRFQAQFPGVKVRTAIADTARITEEVRTGRVEVGLVGARSDEEDLLFQPFGADRLVLVVSAHHPWAEREEVSMEELCRESFLLREPGSGTRTALESCLRESGLSLSDLNVVMELGSTEAIKNAVLAGTGVSILSEQAVLPELRAGLLWAVSCAGQEMTRQFYLVTHRNRSQSALCRRFVRFLLNELSDTL
jgi:DNA-binding transcriptional LysR family regulator